MSNHTYTPGDPVIHDTTGEHGTLTSTNQVSAVVEWNGAGGNKPADILPVTDLEPAPSALEIAADILRHWPRLATQETTAADLCRAADAAGLKPSVLLEAWCIVTGAKK